MEKADKQLRDRLMGACEYCIKHKRWLVLKHKRFATKGRNRRRILGSHGPYVRVLDSTTGVVDIRPETLLKWLTKMETGNALRQAD